MSATTLIPACLHVSGAAERPGAPAVLSVGRPTFRGTPLALEGARSALLESVRREGPGALRDLGGAGGVCVIDGPDCLLAVDRMGSAILFYATGGPSGSVAVGTDPLAVSMAGGSAGAIDPQALFDYMFFHCVAAPRSIYRNVARLEAGSWVRLSGGRVAGAGFHWLPRFAAPDAPVPPHDGLRDALLKSVASSAAGDGAVAAFLSGGLDSSTVAGLLKQATGEARTFSMGFDEAGYDELGYARIARDHFGLDSVEHYVTLAEVEAAIPLLAAAYDEPFGNSSAVPTYLCARLAAADGRQVMLAGDGGDELFAGNERYAKQRWFLPFDRLPAPVRSVAGTAAAWPALDRLPLLRKVASYVRQARVGLPVRMESYNFLLRTPLESIFEPGFLGTVDPDGPQSAMRAPFARVPDAHWLDRVLYMDWQQTLSDNDLRKVGTAAKLAGVEVRYPMLDDAVVDWSLRIPARAKLAGGELRSYYKAAFAGFLPRQILDKEKHGFGLPAGEWLRSPRLSELAHDALESVAARGVFRRSFLDSLVAAHRSGHASYFGGMVWVVMMLELWLQAHGQARGRALA